MTSVRDSAGGAVTSDYDADNRLMGRTLSANGSVARVMLGYMPDGQLQLEYRYAGSTLAAQTTFGYDGRGNLTSLLTQDGAGNTLDSRSYQYDTGDRLTKVTYPSGRYLSFRYDSAGRRTLMVDQDGYTVNYTYDTRSRLSTLTDGNGGLIVRYTYDAVGRLSRKDNGNGTHATYGYDAAGNLLHLVNYTPVNSVNSQYDYTYDSLGRQVTMTAAQ